VIWAAAVVVLLAAFARAAEPPSNDRPVADKLGEVAPPTSTEASCPRLRRTDISPPDTETPPEHKALGAACRGCHPMETRMALDLVRTCLHEHCLIQEHPDMEAAMRLQHALGM
jgi:hypothetical protein